MPRRQIKTDDYDWLGNVRELANVIERAIVLGQGPWIECRNLPSRIAGTEASTPTPMRSYRAALENCKHEIIRRGLAQNREAA